MNSYDEYDPQQHEVMQDIRDEATEYGENVHRAEEDGWFYSDCDSECQEYTNEQQGCIRSE